MSPERNRLFFLTINDVEISDHHLLRGPHARCTYYGSPGTQNRLLPFFSLGPQLPFPGRESSPQPSGDWKVLG